MFRCKSKRLLHPVRRIRGFVHSLIDAALKGTHDHYLFFLPGRKGYFCDALLRLLFAGIKDDPEQLGKLDRIPGNAVIVYMNQYPSKFDFLLYHIRYAGRRKPAPEIGFGYHIFFLQPVSRLLRILLSKIDFFLRHLALPNPYKSGYLEKALLGGHAAFLSLVDPQGFYRRFIKSKTDPVRFLLNLQQKTDRPVVIVPHLLFFDRKPNPDVNSMTDVMFGPLARPGIIRRLAVLFTRPRSVFFEISQPVNLRKFMDAEENRGKGTEYLTLVLRRNLLHQLNRHRQSITGPVVKSRQELKESILTGQRLKSFMDQLVEKRGTPLLRLRKKADAYLNEIAARPNAGMIKVAEMIVGWILKTLFQEVAYNKEELQRVKTMAQQGPVIFVPCHKSHVDYLMLPYLMYQNNMPVPLIAAGKNLSFWPIGPFFRSGGAFFLRRTFRGNVLYSRVFAEYIHKLLEEGYNIKIFIEGTRSRTGKLITPKFGFLSILLNAYKNGACPDLIFAPIFIGYDRVLEEKAYIHEIEGGQKKPESISQVFRARKVLKNRYGKIYIKFSEPLSLNALTADGATALADLDSKHFNMFCRNLGYRIISAIDTVTVVTPHALVACSLLNSIDKRRTLSEIEADLDTYLLFLNTQRATLADTLTSNRRHAVDHVIESYIGRKFIEKIGGDEEEALDPDPLFVVVESKRPLLEFYKNNCISFFVPAALTALSILDVDVFQFKSSDLYERYKDLQYFFKFEFAYDVDRPPEYYVRKTLKAFIDDGVLMPHRTLPETYQLTSAGLRKLKGYGRLLKSFFESYWVVLLWFSRHPASDISSRDRLKKMQAAGSRMLKNHEIDLIESLSRASYANAVNFFTTNGIKGAGDSQKIAAYQQLIQRHLALVNV